MKRTQITFGRGLTATLLLTGLLGLLGPACSASGEGGQEYIPPPSDGGDATLDSSADVSADKPDTSLQDTLDVKETATDAKKDGDASADGDSAGTPDVDESGAEGGDDADEAGDAEDDVACSLKPEVCDGLDNNCNGVKDEGDPGGGVDCQVPNKQGECQFGTTHCSNGSLKCLQNNPASPEICDGKDNDCNGQVDDATTDTGGSCNTGNKGICSAGTDTCKNGSIFCKQNLDPGTETCNGLDDNCDGVPDDGFPGFRAELHGNRPEPELALRAGPDELPGWPERLYADGVSRFGEVRRNRQRLRRGDRQSGRGEQSVVHDPVSG